MDEQNNIQNSVEEPQKTAVAPQKTAVAPQKTAVAPQKTAVAPQKTAVAPQKTAVAPQKTAVAPGMGAPQKTAVAPGMSSQPTAAPQPADEKEITVGGKTYQVEKLISSGTEGDVFIVTDGHRRYALKRCHPWSVFQRVVLLPPTSEATPKPSWLLLSRQLWPSTRCIK